jgi:L-threonylcarbamoyladenylate synthase
VYGIFCNAQDPKAIKKVFAIKERSDAKALPIFVKDIAVARHFAYIADAKAKFLDSVWPGKVTVIFHHKEKLPPVLTGGKDTIGMRIPDHPFFLDLLSRLDFPLAQTSANISGKPPARNAEEIKSYFEGKTPSPDLVIDAGELSSVSSAVVDFTSNEPIIMRSGMITKKDLS